MLCENTCRRFLFVCWEGVKTSLSLLTLVDRHHRHRIPHEFAAHVNNNECFSCDVTETAALLGGVSFISRSLAGILLGPLEHSIQHGNMARQKNTQKINRNSCACTSNSIQRKCFRVQCNYNRKSNQMICGVSVSKRHYYIKKYEQ